MIIEEAWDALNNHLCWHDGPPREGCCLPLARALAMAAHEETLRLAPPISDHQVPALRLTIEALSGDSGSGEEGV